ncbi:hypothetical protein NKG94_31720 [Micromonospora sp. M12]
MVRTRARALIDRVAHLDDAETDRLLRDTFDRFGARHRDLAGTFHHHYDLVRHRAARAGDLSPASRLLVGAYFSHEYAVEAAALCNPSMVAHPDQTDLGPGQLRVAISLRQVGEGTCPRSVSPARSSDRGPAHGHRPGRAVGRRAADGRTAPPGPTRRRPGRGGLRQRGHGHGAGRVTRVVRRGRLRAGARQPATRSALPQHRVGDRRTTSSDQRR